MNIHDSDYVMTCTAEISSVSNAIKKFWIQSYLHSSYIQTKYNDKEESINNIFSTYVQQLLDDINHPALVKGWKLNLDDSAYGKQLDDKVNRPLNKR